MNHDDATSTTCATVSASDIDATRQRLRRLMPVAAKWAYYDHAAVAPLCQGAADAIARWLAESLSEGDTVWLDWARRIEEVRGVAARLVGADASEIALAPNTTAGINFVAEGLDWRPGDNVVTLADEFPSNMYPWLHLADRGVETRIAPTDAGRVDLDRVAQLCDERTRVLSVSWIAYATGCRRDLRALSEIARRCGALFFVDAIQGLGVAPLDVRRDGVDAFSADGHKWLLGPEGAALAYVSRAWLPRLRATGVGWSSVEHAGDFSRIELRLKASAARYEGGSLNMAGFLGLGASLDLIAELGVPQLQAAVLQNADRARQALAAAGARIVSPSEPASQSGIVAFELPGADPQEVRRRCLQRGVALSCRGGRLRISPHAYNDESDLTRLIEACTDRGG
jgi:selenocysteine lyase/cysteine desulfurase